jgi:hypothetical protein
MSSPYTPFLLLGGAAFANDWMSKGQVNLKVPVAAGIASVFSGLANSASPDLGRVITMIGWIGFAAYFVLPGGAGATLLGHLNTITTGKA